MYYYIPTHAREEFVKLLCNISQRTGVRVLMPQLLTSPYGIRFRSVGNDFHLESRLTIRDTSLDSVLVNTWELMFRSQNET